MLPVIKRERFFLGETAETLILNCLLKRSELLTALRDHRAIVFNGLHDLAQTVKLGHVLSGDNNALVLINNNSGTRGSVKHDSVMLTREENV